MLDCDNGNDKLIKCQIIIIAETSYLFIAFGKKFQSMQCCYERSFIVSWGWTIILLFNITDPYLAKINFTHQIYLSALEVAKLVNGLDVGIVEVQYAIIEYF